MKNDRNNASLGLPPGEGTPDAARPESAPAEIDITKDRLGEILAARRHQLGLRLEEIAEDIKIRVDYLKALEQEAFDQMPTTEYGRLFLKSYAERLGLNINDIYALYDVHHRPAWEPPRSRPATSGGKQPIGPTPRLPAEKPLPGKFWLYLLLGIAAIALVIFGVMRMMKSEDGAASLSQSQSRAQPSESPVSQVAAPEQAAGTLDQVSDSALPATVDPEEIVIDAEMLFTLSFDRETWIRLYADGDSIASGNFRAGQTVQAKALDRIVLSLGHTDGVEAAVNGRPLKPFSSWTRGFGGMVITADSVAAWMLPLAGGPVQ